MSNQCQAIDKGMLKDFLFFFSPSAPCLKDNERELSFKLCEIRCTKESKREGRCLAAYATFAMCRVASFLQWMIENKNVNSLINFIRQCCRMPSF